VKGLLLAESVPVLVLVAVAVAVAVASVARGGGVPAAAVRAFRSLTVTVNQGGDLHPTLAFPLTNALLVSLGPSVG
jgi:hypothetical protein